MADNEKDTLLETLNTNMSQSKKRAGKDLGRQTDQKQAPQSGDENALTAANKNKQEKLAQTQRDKENQQTNAMQPQPGQQRKDRPVLSEQNRVDPNRTVRNASNSMVIQGHPCPTICQKLGFSNCRCQKKQNFERLFIAITILLQKLELLHWQLFSKAPVWVHHPHRHHFRFHDPELTPENAEHEAESEPMDVILYNEDDYHVEFELTDDPFMLILRALVPMHQLTREFEIFLKQLAVETPDVSSPQDLITRGYQCRHEPENGLLVLRMPSPEHQLMFLLHLSKQGYIPMEQHQVLDQFSRMMQARYGHTTPKPTPQNSGSRRPDPLEEEYNRRLGRTPSPLKTRLELNPK